jgi:hypothetical protein
MEYSYPELSYNVVHPFERGANISNPADDPWMQAHLEKEGLPAPKRFMTKG